MPEGAFTTALARPALRRADFDELALRATTLWARWLGAQPAIKVPEAAVGETYGAAMVRLRGYSEVPLPELSPPAERALLGAQLQRGLVAYRSGPEEVGLSLAMSARRARLEVRDNHPRQALALLYGLLLHSSAFHGFAEAVPAEWGRRERLDRWAPLWDPEVTAETVQLLREMLVRADGDRLRLFGVVSPAWLGVGEGLLARGVPTRFGPVTTALTRTADGFEVKLPEGLTPAPAAVCVRVPWGWRATGASVDGQRAEVRDGWVEAPPGSRRVQIVGGAETPPDELSYTAVLARYREEYRALAEGFRASGGALETWAPAAPLGLEERRRRFEASHGGGS
ncbi:MAG: hypothetical protein HYU66_11440 [Armatimonadetes bacterium]|nr:hypothetical protein [Armatimonadota bacterium]